MIIQYRKACRKLAMGLLALMPSEKDLRQLQKTITAYENDPAHKLYLWKVDQKIIGIVGVQLKNPYELQLQHLSVLPSFRNQGVARKMVNELQKLFPHAALTTSEHTSSFSRNPHLKMTPVEYDDKILTHHIH
jgi:riboflavin biosynthesis RibT protein